MLRITGMAEGEATVGAPTSVAAVLGQLRIDESATHCTVVSRDGSYSASIPLEELSDNGKLSMEGAGLRLTVVDGTTMCWNVKDVGELRFTAGKEPDSVPARPRH